MDQEIAKLMVYLHENHSDLANALEKYHYSNLVCLSLYLYIHIFPNQSVNL